MLMRTVSTRSIPSCLSIFAMIAMCLIALPGCDEFNTYTISIKSPADKESFDAGDSIPFSMSLTKSTLSGTACIDNDTLIQWASSRDGNFWQEEIMQKVCGENTVTYEQQEFLPSALSAGDHTITCRANRTYESGTYNLATAQVRIYIRESQTPSTTTTTTTTSGGGGEGDLDVTACTALDYLEVRAGEPGYYNNDTGCTATIIGKNNGTRPIQALFYVINDIEHTQPGWVSLYLDPGQEYAWGSVPFWAYQLQADGITRTIITSKATAIYPVDGCVWILDDTNDGVMDAPIETEDISGLDPCN